jgi:hypothetical protein
MRLGRDESSSTYVCGESSCSFHWRIQEGYFEVKDGVMKYPANAHQLLKPALVREHGYLYIASIADGPHQKRTWRCAVKDCLNMIVDDSDFEPTD